MPLYTDHLYSNTEGIDGKWLLWGREWGRLHSLLYVLNFEPCDQIRASQKLNLRKRKEINHTCETEELSGPQDYGSGTVLTRPAG